MTENEDLWRQLGNVISLRSSEDSLLWTGFGIFWGANAVLFVPMFTVDSSKTNLIVVVPFVGIAMSVLWYLIQRHTLGHIRMHEDLMKRLQERLLTGDNKTFRIYEDEMMAKHLSKGPRTRTLVNVPIILLVAIWALLAISVLI